MSGRVPPSFGSVKHRTRGACEPRGGGDGLVAQAARTTARSKVTRARVKIIAAYYRRPARDGKVYIATE
jgi:hypothetical protein